MDTALSQQGQKTAHNTLSSFVEEMDEYSDWTSKMLVRWELVGERNAYFRRDLFNVETIDGYRDHLGEMFGVLSRLWLYRIEELTRSTGRDHSGGKHPAPAVLYKIKREMDRILTALRDGTVTELDIAREKRARLSF